MTARAHTKQHCSSAFYSPSFFLVLGDKETYFFTASWQAFPNSVTTHSETSIIKGQKGQKMLSIPHQVLIATQMPEAMQALTGNLDFTRLLLKSLEPTQQGTPICQQQHLFLWSQMVSSPEENPGDMWEEKNAKSIVTASGYPPNQIEKKTKEIFWLLCSFLHSLWNRWIFSYILHF